MRAHADWNLLVGILAVQMDFIRREQLLAAMSAWLLDKQTPLDEIMLRQGVLRPDLRGLLTALVNKHLEMHENDPQRSLAALRGVDPLRSDLQPLNDPDIEASLSHVREAFDPNATIPQPFVEPAADKRFHILRFHDEGGLGKISVALDRELDREVALKEIKEKHADAPQSRARFTTEAKVTGRLQHPGIVPVYGLGTSVDGRPYYAMRFIEGGSLKEAIDAFHQAGKTKANSSERALELRRLLQHFVDACNAIHYAHSRGVLHRDIKPSNIMLGNFGETLVVDWGLAKTLGKPSAHEPCDDKCRDFSFAAAYTAWFGGRHAVVHESGASSRADSRAVTSQRCVQSRRNALPATDWIAAL
jgi:serine/threonine-protein kinase